MEKACADGQLRFFGDLEPLRDPTAFVEFLLASGADPAIRNHDGRTALEEALEQSGRNAETYFPARTVGLKKLDRVIQLLRDTV